MMDAPVLQHYAQIPAGFIDAEARDLHALLGGPSLIDLPGRREPALFVSVLLHGDETTGVQAVQRVLSDHAGRPLPRRLCLFIGNTRAAAAGVRRLDGQPDFNRIWPGGEDSEAPEARLVAGIRERMREQGLFASIDIHNNSGINPHYGCINRLDPPYLGLAALFSRTVVYFTRPKGVQSLAFADLAPAVTVECGRPGDPHGVEHAAAFLHAALRLERLPDHPPRDAIGLFHTVARARVPETQQLVIGGNGEGLSLLEDLERYNFHELPAGTVIARYRGRAVPLLVDDESGRDVAERYFLVENGELRTRRRVMPSMLTLNERAIRQDCLCYLMERMDIGRDVSLRAGPVDR